MKTTDVNLRLIDPNRTVVAIVSPKIALHLATCEVRQYPRVHYADHVLTGEESATCWPTGITVTPTT